jgi:hypothetical protein
VGRITTVEESRWTTPADHPPGSSSRAPEYIYTPLTLEVEAPVRGGIVGSSVDVRVGGGTVGAGTAACTRPTISGVPSDFEIGQRFAIFLIDPNLVPETDRLVGIWPVTDGVVQTPRDGDMTIEELGDRLTAFPNGENPFGPFPEESAPP